MNPFSALAEYLLGRLKQAALAQWARLLFSMAFSAIVAYLFTCGGALVAHTPELIARGAGMVMSALVMVVLFRRSPLTKGLMVVLPAAEAAKELETNFQMIERK